VVVENVERLIQTEGLSPKEAARKSMDEITSALVGIALVLSAVFLPMAFFGGSTGVIYRQFSITIVTAMVLSVLVAMILTPALCATILKPHDASKSHGTGPLGRFFSWFNDSFDRATVSYEGGVRKTASGWKRSGLIYLLICGVMAFAFMRLPGGFLPEEDQGMMIAMVQGPSGATLGRTDKALDVVRNHLLTN
ncbi:MAG: efflux RND transporter permease subunit, partial [Brevundimonas sp.]